MIPEISYEQFEQVELRVGAVVRVEDFPKARKPAYKIWVDFGQEIGIKQTSAQLTVHYKPEELIGKQVVGCLNLGEKNIAGFTSQFLCTGFPDVNGAVVLISPDKSVPNGAKLF
jgi:tRNA-binding protein